MAACWTHLTAPEREACLKARNLAAAERMRIWREGQPERDRLAAEAERERQTKVATCSCREGLQLKPPEAARWYPDQCRCPVCQSWLCASCDLVRVDGEGGQCAACRPPAKDHAVRTRAVGPYFLIVLGGLENFECAMQLLIRAGARNGGAARTFRVDAPVCASQFKALSALEEFGGDGSNFLTLSVEGTSNGAGIRVEPDVPEPDLSGLGDTDRWWFANGYPTPRH